MSRPQILRLPPLSPAPRSREELRQLWLRLRPRLAIQDPERVQSIDQAFELDLPFELLDAYLKRELEQSQSHLPQTQAAP